MREKGFDFQNQQHSSWSPTGKKYPIILNEEMLLDLDLPTTDHVGV